MSGQNAAFAWQGEKLVLRIVLQPSASQNEWSGRNDGRTRLCFTAHPVNNQANLQCVKFIVKSLKKQRQT